MHPYKKYMYKQPSELEFEQLENLLFQEKFDLVTNLLLSVAVQNENKNALYKAIIEEEDDVAHCYHELDHTRQPATVLTGKEG